MDIDEFPNTLLRRSKRLKISHSKNQSTTELKNQSTTKLKNQTTTKLKNQLITKLKTDDQKELTNNDLKLCINSIPLSPDYQLTNSACSSSTENSINSTYSLLKFNSLYKLFKRLKINKDILKGLKSMNLNDDNYQSINQHKLIYKFLNDNTNQNLYIRSRPYNKIIAYLISCLQQIDTSINQIQVVIIPSTVELGNHIYELALQLTKFTKITVKSISASNNYKCKFNSMLLISTIGTIVYCLIQNRLISFNQLKLIIFDEYDLINSKKKYFMKNQNEFNTIALSNILNKSNLDCKHIYLSTFIDNDPFECAKQLTNSNLLMMNLLEDKSQFFNNILHFYIEFNDKKEKYDYLKNLLINSIYDKVLVFVVGKSFPKILSEQLDEDDLKSAYISTDISNEMRLDSLKTFQNGLKKILILNYPINVGLDFGEVNLIITFDLMGIDKFLIREYFHKIIFCNKFNKPGFAVTFLPTNQSEIITRKLSNFYDIDFFKLKA